MGKPLARGVWENMLSRPWNKAERGERAYAHLLLLDGARVVFVLNTRDEEFPDKPPEWGIPTEGVRDGEWIYRDVAGESLGAAQRALREEVNVFNDFDINPVPIWISVDKHGHFHFVFTGNLEVYPGVSQEVPKRIRDSAEEVTEARFVDPIAEIELVPREKSSNGAIEKFEDPCLEGIHVKPAHLGFINLLPMFQKLQSATV